MNTQPQSKRFKESDAELSRERHLSGLFSIISNNLQVAYELLCGYQLDAMDELDLLSKKAKSLSTELNSNNKEALTSDELMGRVSSLKNRMISLIISLSEELTEQLSRGRDDQKLVQSIMVARRLLRDSRRGLATIRD